ncbi:MAG: hypothetical protein P3W97_010370 [Tepidimonas sp.]|uniref:hypothetical protein n=1 Tax=Tepidimonas sp. TaxID=2002775 RepID=UPI00259E3B2A|nr:hypothetical protein [Tepidimonas sp.]MDM7457631.1 hypothetical protein [Tepidimonas sp.]
MKTKFHLNKRSPGRHGTAGTQPQPGGGFVVALVDERYLAWLASQVSGKPRAAIQRAPLPAVLAHLARLSGAESALLRTVLYTDAAPTELYDDVVLRLVPAHATDGGLALVRSMGQEMTQLARHGAAWLLVASDDERLIPYIDEAQAHGARVVLVADDAVHDFGRLAADDPSWARLLMQADRRVAVPVGAWDALTTPGAGYYAQRTSQPEDAESDGSGSGVPHSHAQAEPDEQWRAQVSRIIQDWWADEPQDERLDLADAMRSQHGVPPETDRRILMQIRRELGRNLSFPEKRLMREMVRTIVLGEPAEPASPAPADAVLTA